MRRIADYFSWFSAATVDGYLPCLQLHAVPSRSGSHCVSAVVRLAGSSTPHTPSGLSREAEARPAAVHIFGGLMGWVVSATPRPLYPTERDPVPILQQAGWAPGPVWVGPKNLAHTGF
jgi:hypothetical protein